MSHAATESLHAATKTLWAKKEKKKKKKILHPITGNPARRNEDQRSSLPQLRPDAVK